ncbi:MAG: 16S rRNA (cytidine(1402)-2'-O)-methyltransferase [Clostridia bacterium]|nr:16S rRNA (cytidine(1402)-2'-O)-methyltransferase [Clostridia bacterium]
MLYFVGTPIGNLGDITVRALETLKSVDFICAEDTRVTAGLLAHFEIRKPLVSYYEHNKLERGPQIVERLKNGENAALVTDAGMPGISDPGEHLAALCVENGIPFTVVPGPCAFVTAAVLSGLPTKDILFPGFFPENKKAQAAFIERLEKETATVCFYDSPHNVAKTLAQLAGVMPDRKIAVARELTKLHEEVFRGTVAEAAEYFDVNKPRGEFVLVLEGVHAGAAKENKAAKIPGDADRDEIYGKFAERVDEAVRDGMRRNEAIKYAGGLFGLGRNDAYKIYQSLRGQDAEREAAGEADGEDL